MASPAATPPGSEFLDPLDDVMHQVWKLLLPNSQTRISAEVELAQHRAIVCCDSPDFSRTHGQEPLPLIPDSRWREILESWDLFESSGRPWH
ncbi:MAG: hypothetical protein C4346_05985 [Chloroflexota bacterium]